MATSISKSIREERATRKNSQLAAAQRVAIKMGRRLRCSSVTYRLDMCPLTASPARTALPAAHFDRNERYAYFGNRTLEFLKSKTGCGRVKLLSLSVALLPFGNRRLVLSKRGICIQIRGRGDLSPEIPVFPASGSRSGAYRRSVFVSWRSRRALRWRTITVAILVTTVSKSLRVGVSITGTTIIAIRFGDRGIQDTLEFTIRTTGTFPLRSKKLRRRSR